MRLVADHYPALPGNGLRSVRISILSIADLVDAGSRFGGAGTCA